MSKPMSNYLSDLRPDFAPFEIDCGKIGAYQYQGNLKAELSEGRMNASTARDARIVSCVASQVMEPMPTG